MSKKQTYPRRAWLSLSTAVCRYTERGGKIIYQGPTKDGPGLLARLKENILRRPSLGERSWPTGRVGYARDRKKLIREIEIVFARVVALGMVTLHAKIENRNSFVRLEAEVWPRLLKIDWNSGSAIADDGSKYLSIHVSINNGRKRGRKPKIDWDRVVKPHVFKFLRDEETQIMTRGIQAKVEKLILEVLSKRDISCAESVARVHARCYLSHCRRRQQKAGN